MSDCDEIIAASASTLASSIRKRQLSSREVVQAFVQQIESVNPSLNAVVWPMFDSALQQATVADDKLAKQHELPLLHGVPVTIKEMFDVAGTPTTSGLTANAKHRAKQDAAAVATLKNAGAIVLGKTNVPLMGLKLSCDNPLYGSTKNPLDPSRTPGGSTGGEAAIIAAKGSPLGLGSDAGGSIRQPSHSCGIVGIKTTGHRESMRGHWSVPTWTEKLAQLGPMARSVEDLELMLQVLGQHSASSNGPYRFGFRPFQSGLKNVRIGFYHQLGAPKPAAACIRAIDETVARLRAEGFDVIPFEIPQFEEASRIYLQQLYADGLFFFKQTSKSSKLDNDVRQMYRLSSLPSFARPIVKQFYGWIGQSSMKNALAMIPKKLLSARDVAQLRTDAFRYESRFQAAMDRSKIDLILGPVSPMPAFRHSDFHCNLTMMYTGLYNLLGMPAGSVPVTKVRADEIRTDRSNRDPLDRCFNETERDSAGLPIGVQVIGRWWREDLVLALMQAICETRNEQIAD